MAVVDVAGVVIGGAGLAMSGASAAGAFGKNPQKYMPTPQELEAAKASNQMYQLGKQIQDPVNTAARGDLQWLQSPEAASFGANDAVNGMWANSGPAFQGGLQRSIGRTNGPSSGAFLSGVSTGANALDNASHGANVQGRMGALGESVNRTGQFLGSRTKTAQSGLNAMVTGGQQASDLEMSRISSEIQNKIAANQAMGQLGGSMMSLGAGLYGSGGKSGGLSDLFNTSPATSYRGNNLPVV